MRMVKGMVKGMKTVKRMNTLTVIPWKMPISMSCKSNMRRLQARIEEKKTHQSRRGF